MRGFDFARTGQFGGAEANGPIGLSSPRRLYESLTPGQRRGGGARGHSGPLIEAAHPLLELALADQGASLEPEHLKRWPARWAPAPGPRVDEFAGPSLAYAALALASA